ncbi:MAG: cyclic nucleotide-binding domain-containing protein [Thermoanaerobaculia bacterium]|jgi:hypothetical protein
MLRESEFIRQLRTLLSGRVSGLDDQRKLDIIRRLSEEYSTGGAATSTECYWVPFVTGRRPIDEATYPGLGSSDHVALIRSGEESAENRCYLLFRLGHLENLTDEELACCEVKVTLSFAGPWGELATEPLPTWSSRRVTPRKFVQSESGAPVLADAAWRDAESHAFVLELSPEGDFLPGKGWIFEDLDPTIRTRATDSGDPFTFGNLFLQQVRAEIVLSRDGVSVSASEELLDVCDSRRFGSLYKRVVERVIIPDTRRQAERHKQPWLSHSYHPWFPVLLIGADKADLYTRALVEDIVHKKRHLTDPRWLLRVGLYLEFLTCIGIFEAVKDDLGDLLTPSERTAYETSPWFSEIRKSVNVEGWKHVWSLRGIVMPTVGAPNAGEVSALNLLAKKKATLAFLETHHEDLKHAIRLAGPNEHNSQETWHRVFRDAERAVLRKTPSAFPEVAALGPKAAEVILWHRKGKLAGINLTQMSSWFGDQDGLYASACNQYRASMNHVADWAKSKALMDHAGNECVPEGVSLLAAFMDGKHVRLGQLQRRDGYAETIDVAADAPAEFDVSRERILHLLRTIPMFEPFDEDELRHLASTVRPIVLGPIERIIVQGRPGSSLFILAEGELEVLVRQADGHDLAVATLDAGAVFGERSLLTGEPRSATVRSIDSAVVYEIGQRQLAPILQARPSAIDELAAIMEPRLRATAAAGESYESKKQLRSLAGSIRKFFLS